MAQSYAPTQIKLAAYRSFTGGLNLMADAFQLGPNESPDMLDVSIEASGGFVQRNVVQPYAAAVGATITNLWSYSTPSINQVVAATSGALSYTTGSVNPATTYSITTVVGVQNYKMPTVPVQGTTASVDVHNIVAVQGPHWELLWESTTALESTFTPAFIVSQEGERYSFWGSDNMLTVWPIPNTALTLNIRAYRNPIDWVALGAGGLIDAPNDFFSTLQHYVLAQGWAQQTDLQQASFWLQQYEAGKARLAKKYLKAPLTENIVLNGGQVTRDLPPRLRYPFESSYGKGY